MSVTPTLVFYGLLTVWALYKARKAISLAGRELEKATVYELTDKLSWIVGGILLALVPIWWKWPVSSYIGAVLVSLIGLTVTAGLAQAALGQILYARSLGHAVLRLFLLGIFLALIFGAFRLVVWTIGSIF